MPRVEQKRIVNFRVIENPEPFDSNKYDLFVDKYNNPYKSIAEIKNEVGINQHQYLKMRKEAISKNDIADVKRASHSECKHYTKTKAGDYVIKKTINGKLIYIGTFEDESLTQHIVEECIKENWDLNKLEPLIDENKKKPKHYSFVDGSYIVQKYINGRNEYFCKVEDEETAVKVVDRLKEVNWDKNQLSIILNELSVD